jgi:hypothetical protein
MVDQDQGASRAIEVEASADDASAKKGDAQESVLKKARKDIKDGSGGGRKVVKEHTVTKEDIRNANRKK